MWRFIAESLQGPSHVASGTCCQDSNGICLLGERDESVLVACVADGAGSAKFSHLGSKIACETVLAKASARFVERGNFNDFTRDEAITWCDEINAQIQQVAGEHDCSTRELATTLSAVITTSQYSYFFQIGDGAMIVRNNGVCGIVFWPQSGEYANSTNFITSDGYHDRLEFIAVDKGCSEVALLTDGLERLALSFNQLTPHAPFFEPLFQALRSANDLESLSSDLRSFLGSKSVQHRSDDDKTLILASRIDADDAA